jgi:hypothetical protein
MEFTGETSIVIEAPAGEIYNYLLDFTRHPEWVANLQKVQQVSEGSVGVGTVFRAQEGPPPVSSLKKLHSMLFFIMGFPWIPNSRSLVPKREFGNQEIAAIL